MSAQHNSTRDAAAGQRDQVVLSVSGLCKPYSHVVAVEQVSFDVRQREVVGLLGPNGAGKTTTINMILAVFRYAIRTGLLARYSTESTA